jgi:hypothetical protein
MKLIELIFRGKYQRLGRGVVKSLYFPKIADYRLSIHRTHHNGKFGVLIRSNEVMPQYRQVGLFGALVLISRVLWGLRVKSEKQ